MSNQQLHAVAAPCRVLSLGAEPGEALPSACWAGCRVTHADDLDQALTLIADSGTPDLFLVVATRPGQIPEDWFTPLRARAPLAGWVGLAGPWCEGELRSGHPWRSLTRWYWTQAPTRWMRGLAEARAGRLAPWQLPPTLTDEERLSWPRPPGPPLAGRIAIRSRDPGLAQWLADFVRHEQGEPVPWSPASQALRAEAVIWDLTGDDDEGPPAISPSDGPRSGGSPSAGDRSPCIVLANFPRLDQLARWRQAGIRAVLPKPFDLADLAWELGQVGPGSPSRSVASG